MNKNKNEITQLSETTNIIGNIEVDNDLRIAGTIKGNVSCTGHLIVLKSAKIEGELKASSIHLDGEIHGNVICENQIILEENCKIFGDLKTKQLIINNGAFFEGNCQMQSSKIKV